MAAITATAMMTGAKATVAQALPTVITIIITGAKIRASGDCGLR